MAGRARHPRHAPRLPEIHPNRHAQCAELEHRERSTSMNHECEAHMQEAIIADRRQVGFVNPLRVHKALTAGIEKRALVWMAERTPSAINSDHLTGLGFVAQLLAGASYALASRYPVALVLA